MKKKLFEKIFTAMKSDRMSDAAPSIDKLIDRNPSNPNNYIKKGDIFQKDGMHKEAIEAYHKAASLLINQGFLKKALVVYKIITRIDPENEKASSGIRNIISELQSERADTFTAAPGLPEYSAGVPQSVQETLEGIEGPGIGQAEEPFEIERNEVSAPPVPQSGGAGDIAVGTDEGRFETSDNDFFKPFSNGEVREIFRRADIRDFNASEMVVTEGDSGDSIYVIKDGKATVISHILGKTLQLAVLTRGDVFGEVAFLTGRTRTASVIADGPLHAYELNRTLIEDMIEQRPEIMDYLNEIYHLRVKETLSKARGKT